MIKELETINDLFHEINYLRKKAELADEILRYYDKDSMTFNVPEKWKNVNHVSQENLSRTPKSPRHFLNKKITELLPFDEYESLVNWERGSETLAD